MMGPLMIIGLTFGGTITYAVIGMFAFYLQIEVAKFRDTEGCAILAFLWPGALALWLFIGWPLMLIQWSYRKATRPRPAKTYREVK